MKPINPDSALKRLVDGNARFSVGLRSIHSLISGLQLKTLAEKGQKPFAIILACSDSRVPTETIFDCSVGDLYVFRVAGNILSESTLSGIEYAMTHFSIPLCVVLGHTECGAVKAALSQILNPAPTFPSPSLGDLISEIIPDSKTCSDIQKNPESSQLAIDLNKKSLQHTARRLQEKSTLVQSKIKQGEFQIVTAIYEIALGTVSFLSK